MSIPTRIADTLGEATGRRHRNDPITGTSGGPAGNARLTAWTGLLLLVLIVAQLITTLDVNGLISWHVVLGTLLVPVALLKTASTSWRVARYYTGHRQYRTAGPPPMPLRLLGPLVVVTTLGLLGSGLALIALGSQAGRRPFVTVLGFAIDTLTLHQAMFIGFCVAAGLHLLARAVPALRLITGRIDRSASVPGRSRRLGILAIAVLAAVLTAAFVHSAAGAWEHDRGGPHPRHGQAVSPE